MNLALTSDLPTTPNDVVFDRMRRINPQPRIASIPPFTGIGRERFPAARTLFGAYGFPDVEYCDSRGWMTSSRWPTARRCCIPGAMTTRVSARRRSFARARGRRSSDR